MDELEIVFDPLPGEALRDYVIDSLDAHNIAATGLFAATLETHSFQARPFYEKYGYQVFATLDDWPPGHAKYFMRKQLAATRDKGD